MNAPFRLTPQAIEDLDAIWWFITKENRDGMKQLGSAILSDLLADLAKS